MIWVLIAVGLTVLACTSVAGAIVAGLWIGTGIYLTVKTQSRGWYADLVFVFVWPIHWIMER
ncbi:hypothetical protein [Caenibius sp. WL]|uniref:hypothetical protein n=1 Tax=Caenibius sp. WL TaxID=2872646 RepID=UPI001C99B3E0|nr:hypothetical protein [Caenibius sp. WL]QZP07795.1 hypothetical protein K5X80_14250 [Caenibius sp. WL]QZP09972.1 hypothetical protein K5X80_16955 [Caenibius sp. WL]